MENSLEKLNNRSEQAEDRNNKFECRTTDIMESEKQKQKRKKKIYSKESLRDLCDIIKHINICIMKVSEIGDKERGTKNI